MDEEIYSKVKDYSKERHRVITYFEIGRLLDEAGNKYGENILNTYSNKLVCEFGKKYNERTLRRIRQYYRIFKDEKWSPLATKLSWSHYGVLITIKDENKKVTTMLTQLSWSHCRTLLSLNSINEINYYMQKR